MAAWMAEFQPDAVVAHSLAVLYAARQVRKTVPKLKILAVEHHANALKSAKRWVLSLLSFWLADHVVYLSQNYVEELRRKIGPLFRERKAATIPNGLDLAAYKPSVGHARGFTVGMQGRFIDSKDFPTLIKALAVANKLPGPPLHLELAGDGPRREEFTTLVAELGQQEHVSFLGLLDHASLLSHMHHWNAYAHATFGETMSIALMEASACALPIVTNDAPGVSTWFRPGLDGLLTPIGDAEAMGQALRKLANDPAYCASLGQAALQVAQEKYSAARAWADYRKLITAS
jgi:glycosyltransferase involved in cell wall biosynthesis